MNRKTFQINEINLKQFSRNVIYILVNLYFKFHCYNILTLCCYLNVQFSIMNLLILSDF